MAYRERLLDRQSSTGRPVRVGLVGAGQMGRGFVAQVRRIAGMDVVEVSPPYDHAEITAFLGNRIVLEALSGVAWRTRDRAGDPVRRPDDPLLSGR